MNEYKHLGLGSETDTVETSISSSLGDSLEDSSGFMLKSLSELFADESNSQISLFGASLSDFMNHSGAHLSKIDVSTMAMKWASSSNDSMSVLSPGAGSNRGEDANGAEVWLASLDNEESLTDFNTSVSKLLGSISSLMSQNRPISESDRQTWSSEVQRLSSIRRAIIDNTSRSRQSVCRLPTAFEFSHDARKAGLSMPEQYTNGSTARGQPQRERAKTWVSSSAARLRNPGDRPAAKKKDKNPPRKTSVRPSTNRWVVGGGGMGERSTQWSHEKTSNLRDPPLKPVRRDVSPMLKRQFSLSSLEKDADDASCSSESSSFSLKLRRSRSAGPTDCMDPSDDTTPTIPRRYRSPRKQVRTTVSDVSLALKSL